MTDPVPLTASERARIWRWQRRMFVFYGIAIALLALAGAAMLMFGDLAWVRRAALAVLVVLLAAATIVQFRCAIPGTLPTLRPAPRLAWTALPARAVPGLRGALAPPAVV